MRLNPKLDQALLADSQGLETSKLLVISVKSLLVILNVFLGLVSIDSLLLVLGDLQLCGRALLEGIHKVVSLDYELFREAKVIEHCSESKHLLLQIAHDAVDDQQIEDRIPGAYFLIIREVIVDNFKHILLLCHECL